MKKRKEKKMVKKLKDDVIRVGKNVKKMKPVSFKDVKMRLKKLQKSKNIKVKKEARKLYNKMKLIDKSKFNNDLLTKFKNKIIKLEKN
jgi:hypothetical protein